MFTSITRNWWIFLLRGISAVIFGILAFAWPGITLAALVVVFGIYAIAEGVIAMAVGFSGDTIGARWWQMILLGVLSVVAGILTFVWPNITAVALLALIAAWAIVRGIVEIYAAVRLHALIENDWLLFLGGICSILFGALVVWRPRAGALAVLWIIGAYAIVYGVVMIAFSFQLHSMKGRPEPGGPGMAAPSH
jgi:uncharacterized membrane protein HdeD (DUF308 family)